jgi:hypothetical protein
MKETQAIYNILVQEYGKDNLNRLHEAVEKNKYSLSSLPEKEFQAWAVSYAIGAIEELFEEFDVELE